MYRRMKTGDNCRASNVDFTATEHPQQQQQQQCRDQLGAYNVSSEPELMMRKHDGVPGTTNIPRSPGKLRRIEGNPDTRSFSHSFISNGNSSLTAKADQIIRGTSSNAGENVNELQLLASVRYGMLESETPPERKQIIQSGIPWHDDLRPLIRHCDSMKHCSYPRPQEIEQKLAQSTMLKEEEWRPPVGPAKAAKAAKMAKTETIPQFRLSKSADGGQRMLVERREPFLRSQLVEGNSTDIKKNPQIRPSHPTKQNYSRAGDEKDSWSSLTQKVVQHSSRMISLPICQCCFEEIPLDDHTMGSCSRDGDGEQHSFCSECIRRYVEEWVFGDASYSLPLRCKSKTAKRESSRTGGMSPPRQSNRLFLPCLSSQCSPGFLSEETVLRAVSASVFQHYEDKMRAIWDSGSGAATDSPTSVFGTRSVFKPPGLGWKQQRWETRVQEQSNVNGNQRSKSDVGFFDVDKNYHEAEEALTRAKLRQCPVCATSFLKDTGCNRMSCPVCGSRMCYLCRKPLEREGYEHFCHHGRVPCPKCTQCPLWTEDGEDEEWDRERLRNIATDQANRMWEVSLLAGGGSHSEEVRLDVERLLDDPASRSRSCKF